MIKRLRVPIPVGATGEFFSPKLTLCADSYSVSVPRPFTAVARKRPRSFCQKCRWQDTPTHAYTLDATRKSCQDPAGNRTTRRPDHRKETQTAVVWSCLPFIRSDQIYLARHSERGKKIRQTEEEIERQHQGMDRPGVRQVPEGSGEQGRMK